MSKKFQKTVAFMLAVIMAMTLNLPSGTLGIFDLVKTANAADTVTYTALDGTTGYTNEDYGNLVDGDTSTKWCCSFSSSTGAYIVFKSSEALTVEGYSITTGRDTSSNSGRNPKSWTLYGCNDYNSTAKTGTWVSLDSVAADNTLKATNTTTYNFTVKNPTTVKYQFFKLEITAIASGSTMQMGEFALNGFIVKQPANGNGTSSSPYQIGTVGELLWFANQVNGGSTSICGKLTADIDLSGISNWTPIGNSDNKYAGTFDGDNHTIQNMPITRQGNNSGLFGYTNGAAIKNIKITGKINLTTSSYTEGYGSIVGRMDNSAVTNCHSSVDITIDTTMASSDGNCIGHIGGIVGKMHEANSAISNCSYSGTIELKDKPANVAAGIAGYAINSTVPITNCSFTGTINSTYTGAAIIGGIFGYTRTSGDVKVTNCLSAGTITKSGDTSLTGMIIGQINGGYGNNAVQNNYYISSSLNVIGSTSGTPTTNPATACTTDELKSGKIAYLLSQGTDGSVWGQDLLKDTLPTLYGDTVYYDESAIAQYYNAGKVPEGDGSTYNPFRISNYSQLVWFQQYVDSGNYSANAVLTEDITANENLLNENGEVSGAPDYTWTPITRYASESETYYSGVFDGQGHTIRGLYVPSSSSYCALFGHAKGTIKNVFITDSYFGGSGVYQVASFVGYDHYGCVIENCGSDATVEGYSYCAGIAGVIKGSITNCYFAGKIKSTKETSNAIASDYYGYGTLTNCYYLNTCGLSSNRATSMEKTQFASGEVCYKLNNGVTDGTQAWYQTIGTDSLPMFDGRIVDYNGTGYFNHCVGEHQWSETPTSTFEPTCTEDGYDVYTCTVCGATKNEANGKKALGHSPDDDGICTGCGAFFATKPKTGDGSEDNPYQIANYSNLVWFQQQVDGGEYSVNAVLTADITANENLLNENGEVSGTPEYTWTPITQSTSESYSGVFDGKGHTIRGLYVPYSSSDYCALFGQAKGTIKNIFIQGSYFGGSDCQYAASFVGNGYSGCVIENCGSDAVVKGSYNCGGIAGVIFGEIRNCYFAGTISANTTYSSAIASDYAKNGTLTNCYYWDDCGLTSTRATSMEETQFESGEVCYKLNNGTTDGTQAWYQTIGTDNLPMFEGDTVNYDESATPQYYNGEPAGDGTEENPFRISNYSQLVWFQQYVDSGNYSANAVLTADITANKDLLNDSGEVSGTPKYTWTPITQSASDSSTAYSGVFDGQGHTIRGLYVPKPSSSDNCALFGKAKGTIKNIFITDSYFGGSGCSHAASFVGYDYGGVIENCGSDAVVVGSFYCGGIAGETGGKITSCYFAGKINSTDETSNAIASDYYGLGTLTSCYYLNTCGLSTTRATSMEETQFASGEVCYKLNNGVTDGTQTWYQTIGTDSLPMFDGRIVDYNGTGYFNHCAGEHQWGDASIVEPTCTEDGYDVYTCTVCGATKNEANGKKALGHDNNDGICTRCDAFIATQPKNGDGSADNPYQIANYGHLMWFQQYVDEGNYSANAVLTADITANEKLLNENGEVSGTPEYTWTPITQSGSDDSTAYSGVFDGQGHTISGLYAPSSYSALFGRAKGTIKNIFITDSCFGGSGCMHAASFVGYGYEGGVIENCGSDAVVVGGLYCGGIAGQTSGKITSCYFAGKISANTTYSSAIASDSITVGTLTSCYYLNTCGLTSTRATSMEETQFASGEVCYKLNNGVTDGTQAWYQTIGTDSLPMFEGRIVDYNGTGYFNHCAGEHQWGDTPTSTDEPTCTEDGYDVYTCTVCGATKNEEKKALGHSPDDDGICNICGEFVVTQPKNGDGSAANPYQIAHYGHLVWFQQYVDSGNYSANAVLTADITANENLLNENGEVSGKPEHTWTPITQSASDYSTAYSGVFDGQGHTIRGLYVPYSSFHYCALFGYANGTIKNIFITDSYFGGSDCYNAASFVGHGHGGCVIENCGSDAVVKGSYNCGGIAGVIFGEIRNCYFAGTISANTTYSSAIASDYAKNGTLTNCYYWDDCGLTSTRATSMEETQFESGEVCYKLNNGTTDGTQAWYQTIGTDKYPTFSGGTVYYSYNEETAQMGYANSPSDCPHSSYTKGFCDICGEPDAPELIDGKYQIASYGNLVWFQQFVDSSSDNYGANAVLTADITANENLLNENGEVSGTPEYTWTPICQRADSSTSYNGVFDGQGHTISGLYAPKSSSSNCALFGVAKGTIKNIFITDSYFGGSGCYEAASFVGYGSSDCVIENCGSDAVVEGSYYCAGIAGQTSGKITSCYFAGKINSTNETSNAIASDYDGYGTLTNCYYLDDCGLTSERATSMEETQFASGEVCYKLNNGVTNGTQTWYQTLTTDTLPKLNGKTVYYSESAAPQYYNDTVTGDVNGNDITEKVDAALVLKYISGIGTLSAYQRTVADVNGDGEADMLDVIEILGLVG